jgi:hypothetical protein
MRVLLLLLLLLILPSGKRQLQDNGILLAFINFCS